MWVGECCTTHSLVLEVCIWKWSLKHVYLHNYMPSPPTLVVVRNVWASDQPDCDKWFCTGDICFPQSCCRRSIVCVWGEALGWRRLDALGMIKPQDCVCVPVHSLAHSTSRLAHYHSDLRDVLLAMGGDEPARPLNCRKRNGMLE